MRITGLAGLFAVKFFGESGRLRWELEWILGAKMGNFSLMLRAEGDPAGARVVEGDPVWSGSLIGKDVGAG